MASALDGIIVLDLSRVLAGPVCTQILGDLGAKVIKIERPGSGDDTRHWGPPFLKGENGEDTDESAYYLSCNRNKHSVTIDIKHPEGQKLIRELMAKADIVIENFKVGGLEKYGLAYEQIKDDFPELIYCSISGFGQNGPLAKEPGYDFLAQALGGLMASTGEPDGAPMKAGVALSDVMTGLYAAIGILSALHARTQTGKGQHVDLALLDVTLAGMSNLAQYYLTSGKVPPRVGNAHASIVPYQTFETADGYIVIAVGNNSQFERLCTALEKPDLAADERFHRNAARVENRDVLAELLQAELKKRNTQSWIDICHAQDIPAAPVNTMDQVFEMDQIKDRQMKISMQNQTIETEIDLVGSPLKFSETPVSYSKAPPGLGEDTDLILKDILKLPEADIIELKTKKIV